MEFYEVTEGSFDIAELRAELMRWEEIYNRVRPHQALDYLTPQELIQDWQEKQRKEVMCH
jgi:transposase InsO family protein